VIMFNYRVGAHAAVLQFENHQYRSLAPVR
jgi:hypothetical protein